MGVHVLATIVLKGLTYLIESFGSTFTVHVEWSRDPGTLRCTLNGHVTQELGFNVHGKRSAVKSLLDQRLR